MGYIFNNHRIDFKKKENGRNRYCVIGLPPIEYTIQELHNAMTTLFETKERLEKEGWKMIGTS